MKITKLLLATEAFMAVVLTAYFGAFPIFNEIPGSDFATHLAFSRSIAHGIFPSLSSALLYQGVEFYLAIPQILFPHANPFILVRLSMALLVFVSPLVVYVCANELFQDSFKAKLSALTYALTGWIWADWVLVTSLFSNFYGFFASLLLVAAVMHFEHKKGMVSWALLALALVNSLFSHYTTLLVFPPLMVYLAYRRNFVGLIMFMLPAFAGLILFPSVLTSLLNFLAPTTVIGPGSSSLPAFSLSALDSVLTDYEFAFLMLGAVAFGYLAFKKRDSKMLFLLAWFILPLVIAPLNSSAWRFAFMALVPGTLMLGYVLASIPKFPLATRKGVNHKNFYRTLVLIGLVVSPVFYPSWGYLALTHSLQTDPQQGVYDSLVWMGHTLTTQQVCYAEPQEFRCPHMVSVNDWRLTYSPLFYGPMVLYLPDYGVLWQDPLQTQLFALHNNSTYIAVVKDGTLATPPCDSRYSFGLSLTSESRTVPVNQSLLLTASAIRHLNATANLYEDGKLVSNIRLMDGQAEIRATFHRAGSLSLVLAIGSTATSPLNLTVGPPLDSIPTTSTVPPLFCEPFWLYNAASMSGWSVVYRSGSVVIWHYGKS